MISLRWCCSIVLAAGVLLGSGLPVRAAYRSAVVVRDYAAARPTAYVADLTFDKGALHMETSRFSGGAADTDLIYNIRERKVWHIDHTDRSYVEVDEHTAVWLSDGFNSAVDVIGAWWSGEEKPPVPLTTLPTGAKREVQGVPCQGYEIRRGDTLIQTVWLTSWDNAGLTPEAFGAVRRLALSSDSMLKSMQANPLMGGLPYLPLSGVAGLDGYPVVIRHYQGDRVAYEIILPPPTETEDNPSGFKLAPGYTRKLM